MILNPKDLRLNGTPGTSVRVDEERWSLFPGVALHFDATSSTSRLSGLRLNCVEPPVGVQSFVAEPLAPLQVSNFGFQLLARANGELYGFPMNHRGSDLTLLNEHTVVLALGSGGLTAIDVSAVQDGVLSKVAHIPAPVDEDFNDVVAYGQRYLFAASKRRGLVVWDFATPETPSLVTEGFPLRAPLDGHNLLIKGDTLYLAQAPAVGTGALTAFDIGDPTTPVESFRFEPLPGHDVHDVNVAGDAIYVSSLRGGLYVLGVRREGFRAEVEVVAHHEISGAHNVALLTPNGGVDRFLLATERVGGEVLLGRFELARGAPSLQLELMAQTTLIEAEKRTRSVVASPHNIECSADTCFMAHYQLGVRAFDWAGTTPRELARFQTWQPSPAGERDWLRGASGVLLTPSVVYVLDTQNGLFALRYAPE